MDILKKMYHIIFPTADKRVECYIALICWLKKREQRALGIIISRRLQRNYGIFLPYAAKFNSTLILRHPIGIVIGEGAEIGNNVTIFQNVTLGRADTHISAYPRIGDNTIIYAGAAVVGGVKIGNNCVVGANSVVIKDVPDNCIAVGVPAKNIPNKVSRR